jgi:hypothetical protein
VTRFYDFQNILQQNHTRFVIYGSHLCISSIFRLQSFFIFIVSPTLHYLEFINKTYKGQVIFVFLATSTILIENCLTLQVKIKTRFFSQNSRPGEIFGREDTKDNEGIHVQSDFFKRKRKENDDERRAIIATATIKRLRSVKMQTPETVSD